MNKQQPPVDILVSTHNPDNSTFKSYVIGFGGSIIITLTAYLLVRYTSLSLPLMLGILAILAISQFSLQMIYFLHIGREFSPRLKLIVLLFMVSVVIILVGGSLWIMHSLEGRMFSTKFMETYMNNENIL